MKIVTWNVAGYRAVYRKGALQDLIEEVEPDMLFLQEVKVQESQVPWIPEEYRCFVNSGKVAGLHGTMALIKAPLVEELELSMANDNYCVDSLPEGRLQVCSFRDTVILNSYSVNSRKGLDRLNQRLAYDGFVRNIIEDNIFTKHIILLGDLNCTHQPVDIWTGRLDPFTPCQSPREVRSFDEYLNLGLYDVWRAENPDVCAYSYWSYFGNARITNKGWRLDYFLLTESSRDCVNDCRILNEYHGSDHAPVLLDIDFINE